MTLMFEDTVGDLKLEVNYESPNFHVKVKNINDETKYLEESFLSIHEPRFGIDVEDMREIMAKAEEMAVKLETNAS